MSSHDKLYAVLAGIQGFCAIGFLVQAYRLHQVGKNWDEVGRIQQDHLRKIREHRKALSSSLHL